MSEYKSTLEEKDKELDERDEEINKLMARIHEIET